MDPRAEDWTIDLMPEPCDTWQCLPESLKGLPLFHAGKPLSPFVCSFLFRNTAWNPPESDTAFGQFVGDLVADLAHGSRMFSPVSEWALQELRTMSCSLVCSGAVVLLCNRDKWWRRALFRGPQRLHLVEHMADVLKAARVEAPDRRTPNRAYEYFDLTFCPYPANYDSLKGRLLRKDLSEFDASDLEQCEYVLGNVFTQDGDAYSVVHRSSDSERVAAAVQLHGTALGFTVRLAR